MKRLAHKRQTVIVDFSRGSIQMAVAESACEAVRFRAITRIRLPDEGDEAQRDACIARRIREEVQRRGWSDMPAACLLSGSATSTQSFLFPPMPDAELREAIELKLAETLHFDVDQAAFDFRRVREYESDGNPQVLTLVVAARQEAIERALRLLREAGLRPTAIGASSESLANLTYYASLCVEGEATIHADIGASSTILNLFEGRLLRFSREVDVAGDSFTQALLRPIITAGGPVSLTAEQAEEVKRAAGYPREDEDVELPHGVRSPEILPLLEPVAQRMTAEIQRSIDYLRGILGRTSVDRIVLSGPAAKMRKLDVLLEENLHTKVVRIDPVARATDHWRLAICDESPPSPAGFSAILGFSLGEHRPINLLPREERVQNVVQKVAQVRRAVVPSAVALAACLALVAIPIDRNYGRAHEAMRYTSESLNERLRVETELGVKLTDIAAISRRVTEARGPLPDWSGILKELATVLPGETQIRSLAAESKEGVPTLELRAKVHESAAPSERVLRQTTRALSQSPFFTNVRVLEASAARHGSPGSFEATLEILAPLSSSPEVRP
jgi:type IV pilus assembly protein PilM